MALEEGASSVGHGLQLLFLRAEASGRLPGYVLISAVMLGGLRSGFEKKSLQE